MDNKSGAIVQENYRKTTEVVRPCEENERGAHSEKKVRCGHSGKKKKRMAKPTMARCMQVRHDRSVSQEDNTTNMAAFRNKIISYTGDPR